LSGQASENALQPREAQGAPAPGKQGELKRVVFLADGAEDYRERFASLVAALRSVHPDCLVTAILYFEGNPFAVPTPAPFDAMTLAFDRAGLRSELQGAAADLVIVLMRHHPTPHDHDLTLFAEARRHSRLPTAYLFSNSPALQRFLDSGADDLREVQAHLQRCRRRNLEIGAKITVVNAFAALVLPVLALARRVAGSSAGARKRLLFIRLDVLGDMILTLPALKALREQYPRAEITVIASKRGAALLAGQGGSLFDRLIVWESPWHSSIHTLLGGADLLATLRFLVGQWRVGYDLVLQPVELGTGVLFALLFQAGSTVSVISERLPLARLLRRFVSQPVSIPVYRIYHIADLPDAVAVEAGVSPDRIAHFRHRCLEVDEASRKQVRSTLHSAGYHQGGLPLVLVNVGAGHQRRRWSAGKFAALCDALGSSCFLVLVGGDQETDVAAEIAARTSSKVLNLAGELTLPLLIALTAQCDLMVTGDTGVMHLAAALNRRIVALFGAGLLDFCRPLCDSYLIVRHELGCSGCHDVCFSQGAAPCMEMIQVDEVVAAALQLLREKDEP